MGQGTDGQRDALAALGDSRGATAAVPSAPLSLGTFDTDGDRSTTALKRDTVTDGIKRTVPVGIFTFDDEPTDRDGRPAVGAGGTSGAAGGAPADPVDGDGDGDSASSGGTPSGGSGEAAGDASGAGGPVARDGADGAAGSSPAGGSAAGGSSHEDATGGDEAPATAAPESRDDDDNTNGDDAGAPSADAPSPAESSADLLGDPPTTRLKPGTVDRSNRLDQPTAQFITGHGALASPTPAPDVPDAAQAEATAQEDAGAKGDTVGQDDTSSADDAGSPDAGSPVDDSSQEEDAGSPADDLASPRDDEPGPQPADRTDTESGPDAEHGSPADSAPVKEPSPADTESRSGSDGESHPDTEPHPGTEPHPSTETHPAEKADPDAEAGPGGESGPGAEADPDGESGPDAEAGPGSASRSGAEADPHKGPDADDESAVGSALMVYDPEAVVTTPTLRIPMRLLKPTSDTAEDPAADVQAAVPAAPIDATAAPAAPADAPVPPAGAAAAASPVMPPQPAGAGGPVAGPETAAPGAVPMPGAGAPPEPVPGAAGPMPGAPGAAGGVPVPTQAASPVPTSPVQQPDVPQGTVPTQSGYGYVALPTPEPIPTIDPRLSIALGKPQHGDSVKRRTGHSLRRTVRGVQEQEQETRRRLDVALPVQTGRVIAVTSIRGGVGKTTVATLMSKAFNRYRHDPVLTLEADAALGTLAVRMGAESVRWSCMDLAQILHPEMRLTDITGYMVQVNDGGWLLPASQGRVGAPLDVQTYFRVVAMLRRYFAVTVVDCETLPGDVARTAMDTSHARVVVAPMTAEGVDSTRVVLDWLAHLPHSALASTVVALTAHSPDVTLDTRTAEEHLRETGVAVVTFPYDRHLAQGGPIHAPKLSHTTRDAAVVLAAEMVKRSMATPH